MGAGDEFVHKAKGTARAKGNVDVLRPGDPGYGGKASSELPQPKGLRLEKEAGFQRSEDDDEEDMVRVIDTDPNDKNREIVIFSGSQKQLDRLMKVAGEGKASKSAKKSE